MASKSKKDIFNKMTKEELDRELKNKHATRREYQRLVAMKGFSKGMQLIDVAEIVGVSYRTVQRWAKSCSENGLEGLLPSFNGGRIPNLTVNQKLMFGNELYLSDMELDLDDARQILIDMYGVEYTKVHISKLIKSLGFEYTASQPIFIESDDDKIKILEDRIIEANITPDDFVYGVDESTMKPGHKTKKTIKLIETDENKNKVKKNKK